MLAVKPLYCGMIRSAMQFRAATVEQEKLGAENADRVQERELFTRRDARDTTD